MYFYHIFIYLYTNVWNWLDCFKFLPTINAISSWDTFMTIYFQSNAERAKTLLLKLLVGSETARNIQIEKQLRHVLSLYYWLINI